MTLTAANQAALDHVRAVARRDRPRHLARLSGHDVEAAADAVRAAPVTINFHPDRLLADSRPVARALAERVTGGVPLDAANIGATAAAASHDAETLQHLKYLWRMVVVYGEPR